MAPVQFWGDRPFASSQSHIPETLKVGSVYSLDPFLDSELCCAVDLDADEGGAGMQRIGVTCRNLAAAQAGQSALSGGTR